MRLADVHPETFATAVRIYLTAAYGEDEVAARWPEALRGETTEAILRTFEDETRRRGEEGLRRYVLRLGNRGYPHMKLVFQEVLIPGEFFFAVDTHDDMELKPEFPGYDEWLALKALNREIQGEIETRFRTHPDVPTSADLREMIPPPERVPGGTRVLIVDDEEEIADTVAALLSAEGYAVRQAYDGHQALEAVEAFAPELVVMDYQMPGLDGVEVCRELRSRTATRDLPIVLATASMVDLTVFGTLANGFLMKPYNRDFLVGFVKRLRPPRDVPRDG